MPPSAASTATFAPPRGAGLTLSRLGRLALKELRETLRDRRTIITLVLMPVLVYPLLSLAFRQFLVSGAPDPSASYVRVGIATDREHDLLRQILRHGDRLLRQNVEHPTHGPPPLAELTPPGELSTESFQFFTSRDPRLPIQDLPVDLAVRIEPQSGERSAPLVAPFTFRIWYLPNSPVSCQAARHIEQRLRAVNEDELRRRVRALDGQGPNIALPMSWDYAQLSGAAKRSFWLASLVPLILITMTITGAVYPAIDLTAGERERGTLESLMAAPVPRLGLLLAKYVAVVTVAILTAVMNLLAMTITIATNGLGPALFGERGLSLGSIAIVFALLVLFAAFFSAVLLSITSFARSFKEAQAYLIPLMLVSLAPGFLSVMPDVQLSAVLSVTPLANIVLLARDVLEGDAPPLWATVAVLSTLLYAAVALAVAARIFGSDAILYGSEGSWGDLFRRPARPLAQASIAGALAALAVVTPLYILLGGLPSMLQGLSMPMQLLLAGTLTLTIFFATPCLIARWQGVALASGFQLRRASWLSFLAGVVLGFSLAPLAYELIIGSRELGIATLSDRQLREFMSRLQEVVTQWHELHPLAILVPLAIIPAVCEEWFFRGYLLGSLRGRAPAWLAIGATALAFGLFHASLGGVIMVERVLSSAALGLVLGWLCWSSQSVFPGMILHAINNGLMLSLAYWGDGLKSLGLDIRDQQHLPPSWLAAAVVLTAIGLALSYIGRRPVVSSATIAGTPMPAPLPAPPEPHVG
jgi:ABC-2 type transport system permease protein/sodium transport system permease protein